MVATGINSGGCHFDVDSGAFLCDIGTFTWLSGTLMLAFCEMTMYSTCRLFVAELLASVMGPDCGQGFSRWHDLVF